MKSIRLPHHKNRQRGKYFLGVQYEIRSTSFNLNESRPPWNRPSTIVLKHNLLGVNASPNLAIDKIFSLSLGESKAAYSLLFLTYLHIKWTCPKMSLKRSGKCLVNLIITSLSIYEGINVNVETNETLYVCCY